jgi:small-conductance mechanosensitive channel
LILHTTVTIGYDVPWRQVHELLLDAALVTDCVEEDPEPFVRQTSLDDFYVSYELNAYTASPTKKASTYSELHSNIQDAFNRAGVEIMSPHYAALRDGNRLAVPDDSLPKDYKTPGIRIHPLDKIVPGRDAKEDP